MRSKRVKIKLFFPNLYNFFFMCNFYYFNIPVGEIFHFCEFFKVSNNFFVCVFLKVQFCSKKDESESDILLNSFNNLNFRN